MRCGGSNIPTSSNGTVSFCGLAFSRAGVHLGATRAHRMHSARTHTPLWFVRKIHYYISRQDNMFGIPQMKQIMDAIRTEDNKGVVIKRIKAGSDELSICQMLSTPECRKDPRNHAVPLLDYFINDKNTQEAFIVMPILRNFDDPSFETVDEVVEFIRQILEVCLAHVYVYVTSHKFL